MKKHFDIYEPKQVLIHCEDSFGRDYPFIEKPEPRVIHLEGVLTKKEKREIIEAQQ